MLEDRLRAMNTEVVLAAEGEAGEVREGFAAARQFIEMSERRFSRFLEDSELCQLNRSAGELFKASTDLFEVLQEALGYAEATGGLFNPAILAALRQAGYDRSMDELRLYGARPAQAAPVLPAQDIRGVRLDPEGCLVFLPAGMTLDLGGIAKGWIAEKAAGILARYSRACGVDAGGDLFLHGLPDGEIAWEVELEDPRDPQESFGVLRVAAGAVATSSVTKRRWLLAGREQHHLIDPRTGQPAETPWLSVTVYAAHASRAEAWAKALLIAGPLEAIELQQRSPELAFIAVDNQGRLWSSKNSEEVFNVRI